MKLTNRRSPATPYALLAAGCLRIRKLNKIPHRAMPLTAHRISFIDCDAGLSYELKDYNQALSLGCDVIAVCKTDICISSGTTEEDVRLSPGIWRISPA